MPRIETRKKGGLPEPVIKTTTDFSRQYFFSNTHSIQFLFWEFGPLLHLTTGSRILSSEKEATGPGQPQSCQEIDYIANVSGQAGIRYEYLMYFSLEIFLPYTEWIKIEPTVSPETPATRIFSSQAESPKPFTQLRSTSYF